MIRVNLNIKDNAIIERVARRQSARFVLLVDGQEKNVNLTSLQSIIGRKNAEKKVLNNRGVFAIVDNVLITILEN